MIDIDIALGSHNETMKNIFLALGSSFTAIVQTQKLAWLLPIAFFLIGKAADIGTRIYLEIRKERREARQAQQN